MALTELETARAKKALDEFMERRRPPPHIRGQLDLGYRITGQSVELFEVRPVWNQPSKKMESPVAKATFVRTQNVWRVYWQRADLKWHLYEPASEVAGLAEFLSLVENDAHACFWGGKHAITMIFDSVPTRQKRWPQPSAGFQPNMACEFKRAGFLEGGRTAMRTSRMPLTVAEGLQQRCIILPIQDQVARFDSQRGARCKSH